MTRIGLLSDTHSYLDPKVFEFFKDVDEVWHAGDIGSAAVTDALAAFKPLYAVYGNIDDQQIRREYPLNLELIREGLRILITHIGGYPGHYEPRARRLIAEVKPDIFVCGHSHILRVLRDEQFNRMLVLNPGAAGVHGFHQLKTILRFTLHNKKVQQMEAIELGKRGAIV